MSQKSASKWIAMGCVVATGFSIPSLAKEAAKPAASPVAVATKAPPVASVPKVTFVEMGSKNCVPCKAMKLITDKLEQKYPKDLRVVFHDVWTEDGEKAAAPYNIRSIPTQVFLDRKGVEFFRHEGYYAQEEIEKLLKSRQVVQ